MSDIVESEKKTEIEEVEEPTKRLISPEMCSYVNDEGTGYVIEIILPGVEKDTISLKLNEEYLFVRGETDTLKYIGDFGLCCPVDAGKAKSTYNNGLLKIEVPFKDLSSKTVDVEIV